MADVPVTMTVSAKGVDATTRALGEVTRSMDRMRRMQTQAVAVGTALGNIATRAARQVYAFGREALTAADGVAKSARAFGVSAEAYQELRFAAARSGVDIGAVNVALRTMSQRMVVSGTYANQLGLSFDHLRGLSPDKQFLEVGKALASIKDPAQRTAVAVDMFGRQGARIAQMAADFDGLAAEAHRLGIVIKDGPLRVAERFNDQMSDLKMRLQASFVNTLPDVKLFATAAAAGFRRFYDVAVAVVTAIMGLFYPTNWKPIFANLAEGFTVAFTNAFENLKRLVQAAKTWLGGGEFKWDRLGAMEGAQFQEIPLFRDLAADIDAANAKYEASLQRAAEDRVAADTAVIKSAEGVAGALMPRAETAAPDRARFAEAATFGSAEAARAINRMRLGGGTIEQRQLTALEQIQRNTAAGAAGGVELLELEIA